ncbi:hypothetical protein [Vibrio campbellii]
MKGKILFITTIFGFSFADETSGYDQLVASAYSVATWVAVLIGLSSIFFGLKKLKDYGDNQNQSRVGSTPFVFLFVGSVLMSYSQMIASFSLSFIGDDAGFCFGLEESVDSATEISSNCWKGEGADFLSPELKAKLDSEEQKSVSKWIESAFYTLQLLGFIWFINIMVYMKKSSESQNEKTNAFKVIGGLIGCAALFNANATIEILKATFESFT